MLRQKLQDDSLAALKTGDKEKLSVLRFIIAQIKNKEIDKKTDLNDEETLFVLKKFAKELNESIEAFTKGGRTDLVAENKKQLEIVSVYLPAEITDEELKKEVDKIVTENKQIYDQNPKAIIGICMKLLKSKADPQRIMKVLSAYGSH
ncbi:GatB/YqeY domain-containing protein [Candidatus Roizmanbacteria bacterium]|nr:GatB/YqeY domain-containing protein [Candidatus Roizmanbacteria bacterium]